MIWILCHYSKIHCMKDVFKSADILKRFWEVSRGCTAVCKQLKKRVHASFTETFFTPEVFYRKKSEKNRKKRGKQWTYACIIKIINSHRAYLLLRTNHKTSHYSFFNNHFLYFSASYFPHFHFITAVPSALDCTTCFSTVLTVACILLVIYDVPVYTAWRRRRTFKLP